MFDVLSWCFTEDYDVVKVDEGELPLTAEKVEFHGSLESSRRIVKSNGQSNKLV